jgi:hypothetical protein
MNATAQHSNLSIVDAGGGSQEWPALLGEPHTIVTMTLLPFTLAFNAMSLVAIFTIKGRLTTHFRFLVSLAFSDIFVALSCLAFNLNQMFNPVLAIGEGSPGSRYAWCGVVILKALNTTSLLVTLFSLLGMSVDAYIAILHPSYYMSKTNVLRSFLFVILLWVVAFICGFFDLIFSSYGFVAKGMRKKYNYCEFTYVSLYQEEYIMFATALLCMVSMSYLYCRIYTFVKAKSWPGLQRDGRQRHSNRERKVLLTTIIILVTFFVCFVPMCAFNISLVVLSQVAEETLYEHMNGLREAEKLLLNLFLLNGVIDPIIYTVRIPEVQQSYRRFCGCANQMTRARVEVSLGMSRSALEEESSLMKR